MNMAFEILFENISDKRHITIITKKISAFCFIGILKLRQITVIIISSLKMAF